MKKTLLAGFAAVLALGAAGFAAAQTHTTISGYVTASQMSSSGSLLRFQKALNCHGEADCANRLVAAGGKYVLVTTKGVYQLSDQAKAAQFVAKDVTINGVFDNSKNTIAVADMQVYNPTSTNAGLQ
jgi:hypothetical protein